MNKRLWSFITMGVTLVLLVLVVREVGAEEVVTLLRQADPTFIALSFGIGFFVGIMGAFKWHLLLRAQGIHVSVFYLIKLYLVGVFFNNFLPTNVGGDVVRTYELGRRINDQATSLASVFVERFTGFMVLIIFASVSFLTHLSDVNNPLLALVMVFAVVGLIGVAWMALDARLLNLVERLMPLAPLKKATGKFRKFQNALHEYRGKRRASFGAILWSVVFYVGAILCVAATISAFYRDFSLTDLAAIVPITMVVAMMPFSFNGIGLQEWAYVLLFPTIGIPASVGLSSMVLIRAFTLIYAIVGGLMYLQLKSHRHEDNVSTATPVPAK